jgi:DNA-directed RNA polymerase specialized sigma24 family protein
MRDTLLLESMSLAQLEIRCLKETSNWRQKKPSDPRFCLEIFHRALQLAHEQHGGTPSFNDEACTLLVRIYTSVIKANVSAKARHILDLEEISQEVWLRFWSAARWGLTFPTLPAAIGYLKLATVRTVIKLLRSEDKSPDVSLDQLTSVNEPIDNDANVSDIYKRRALYQRMLELTPDPLERRILLMRYYLGLSPKEIARQFAVSDHPLKEKEISTILRRIFKRFEHDPAIKDLLQSD